MVKHNIDLDDLRTVEKQSRCLDHKVAAILYDQEGNIKLSASNLTICSTYCRKLKGQPCPAAHAEMILVNKIKEKPGIVEDGDFVMVSLQPCINCALALCQAGIKQLYYIKDRGYNLTLDTMVIEPLPVYYNATRFDLRELYGEIQAYQGLLNSQAEVKPETKVQKVEHAKQLILCMHSELSEVLNTMDWKYWKQSFGHIEYDHFKEEMADVFFFWIELLSTFGVTLPEIEETITDKLMTNYNRLNGED